jgi:hypothetical protein
VFGITASMGLLALILGLLTLFLLNKTIQNNSHPTALTYLLVLFFSHSILFSFKYIDAVFLDLPITIPLILLITLLIWSLIQNQKLLLALGIFLIAIITQLLQLKINTENQTPMQTYRFHQSTILFSQKKEIVKNIYGLVGNEKFTLGVMGTPYGVQTTWATIFENYLAENLNLPKPDWFGAHSIGYPYDSYFTKVDHPEKIHVVILEDNILALTNEVIVGNFLSHADESTTIIKAVEIDGFTIQIRSKKQ